MNDAAQRRLVDRLRPDTSRTGRVRRLLATTHNLDADFFDTDFLCTALSIAQADYKGHSGRVALQRKLAGLEYCGVLCEARAYDQRPSLRTVVHPVTLRGACLHAKLVVIEYDHAVRLLVGSANLTQRGYHENREVSGELLAYHDEPAQLGQANSVLREAREVLGAFRQRASEFLAQLEAVIRRLDNRGAAQPVEPAPVIWSDGERPLWGRLLERWPSSRPVERVRIVSPFWSEDGSTDTPLRRLLRELKTRNALAERCTVELLVESVPLAGGGFACKERPSIYYADLPGVSVRVIPVDPKIATTDLDVRLDLTATRTLHAKVLVLEGRDHALAYAGSANFTRNGFGLRHAPAGGKPVLANIEAGWVFELPLKSVATLLPPTANDGEIVASLAQPGRVDIENDEPELSGFWPESLLSAELTPSATDETLELTTRWSADTPLGWSVHAGASEADDGAPGSFLFTTAGGVATLVTPLSDEALEAILCDRHILVAGADGRARFPVNVAAGDARHRLPISPSGKPPGEDELLGYYQGRITFDELYPDHEAGPAPRDEAEAGPHVEQKVDKSRIQAYQIRAFVDALPGMRDELLAAQGSEGALYQAFLGEVSPLALARHVVDQVGRRTRSVTAGAFQLAELLAMLAVVAAQAPQGVEHYTTMCAKARQAIDQLLGALRQQHTLEVGPKSAFARYLGRLEQARG